jgi:putative transposase
MTSKKEPDKFNSINDSFDDIQKFDIVNYPKSYSFQHNIQIINDLANSLNIPIPTETSMIVNNIHSRLKNPYISDRLKKLFMEKDSIYQQVIFNQFFGLAFDDKNISNPLHEILKPELFEYQTKIKKHCFDIWIPETKTKLDYNNVSDSWFCIDVANVPPQNLIYKHENPIHEDSIKAVKLKLHLIENQKTVINSWLLATTRMYNEALKLIKINQRNFFTNFHKKQQQNIRKREIVKMRKQKIEDRKKEAALFKKTNKHVLKNLSNKLQSKKQKKEYKQEIEQDNKLENKLDNKQENKVDKKMKQEHDYLDFSYLRKILSQNRIVNGVETMSIKQQIQNESQVANDKNTCVRTHILDEAIRDACARYKSAITNYKYGYIKKFRLRYLKFDIKNPNLSRTFHIEKGYFSNNLSSFCESALGLIKCTYDGKPFDLQKITTEEFGKRCTLRYHKGEYELFAPQTTKKEEVKNSRKKIIVLDPGIRTFLTGISENQVVKVCNYELQNKLREKINELQRYRTGNYPNRIKNKYEAKISRKISNLVDEVHWKTINFLTKNYDTIILGNLSTKDISSNERSNISKLTKRIASSLKLYQFRQRLEEKCKLRGVNFKLIDESYTSKTCSVCNQYNETLGGKVVFECDHCNRKIERDINGARGIFIKSRYLKDKEIRRITIRRGVSK